MWGVNYSVSLGLMEDAIFALENISGTELIIEKIEDIILSINDLIFHY